MCSHSILAHLETILYQLWSILTHHLGNKTVGMKALTEVYSVRANQGWFNSHQPLYGMWIPKLVENGFQMCKFLYVLIPGFVCQAVQCGWADCVPVLKGFEVIVSQPPLSESQFHIDLHQ